MWYVVTDVSEKLAASFCKIVIYTNTVVKIKNTDSTVSVMECDFHIDCLN